MAAPLIQFKTCTSCGREKPLAKFHLDARSADGYRNVCKVCRMNEGKLAKRHGAPPASALRAAVPARQPEYADAPEDGAPAMRQSGVGDVGDELTIETPDEPDRPPRGSAFDAIMDAMKGTGAPSNSSKATKGEREDREAFAEQIATLGGYGLYLGGALAIPHPYKPVGPQFQHGHAIIKPLAEIVAERFDVAGHLSPTTIRLMESATAAVMYGQYAVQTYLAIRQQEAINAGSPPPSNRAAAGAGSGRAAGTAPLNGHSGLFGAAQPVAFERVQERQARSQARHGHTGAGPARQGGDGAGDVGAAGDGDAARHAAQIDELLRADAEGRRRLGFG